MGLPAFVAGGLRSLLFGEGQCRGAECRLRERSRVLRQWQLLGARRQAFDLPSGYAPFCGGGLAERRPVGQGRSSKQ